MAATPKFKFTEWVGSSGHWYCGDVSNLAAGSNNNYLHAKELELTLEEFAELIKTYAPDNCDIIFNQPKEEKGLILYWWESQAAMRKFKNAINRLFRQKAAAALKS